MIEIKLDYTLQSPEERNEYVKQLLANEEETPNERTLEFLADYLIEGIDKKERKERKILTENRQTTINKRETSFEGLVTKFENGEDGIYNILNTNKQVLLQPKVSITKKDLDEIPLLKQLHDAIAYWEIRMKMATGRDASLIRKTLIELRKDQYLIRSAYKRPISPTKILHSRSAVLLDGYNTIKKVKDDILLESHGIELTNPEVCSAILCNYSRLKEDSWGDFEDDTWYLLYDFEQLCDKALAKYPLYMRIVELKIDGRQNAEIQEALQLEFGVKHTYEYISSLWRKKIPSLIAAKAEDDYLNWYFTHVEEGDFKICNKCGQKKLRINRYFSKNSTSSDGFYSICKECRSKRKIQKAFGQFT